MKGTPPEIVQEIAAFEQAVNDWLAQKISDKRFQRIRLQHGVYGQRQDGIHMIRIKIPWGGLNAEQFETIADVCEKYSRGITHITTRQDIQIHYVKLNNVPQLMRELASVGVTTREACGNTVRNVTACPYAGVSPTEPFDVTPYAQATMEHLIRNPICQNMGRKFKIAFEGCHEDHARLRIHDIGFKARVKDGRRGFQVLTGGGLGATPRVADEFYDFMPEEELLLFCEAVLRVFDRTGERRIRSKARMKFVVKKYGFKKFKELVEAERKYVPFKPEWNDYLKKAHGEWEQATHQPSGGEAAETPEFLAWKKTNVRPQRQQGYSIVDLKRLVGDTLPGQVRGLAALARQYAAGWVRLTIEQNYVLRWVHNEDLPALYVGLKKLDLVAPNVGNLYDVTACPGTDTCRLGIAGSIPLAKVLEERLRSENGTLAGLADQVRIKISGCPNSCGQHHIGNIGFHGGALPQGEHTVPAFQLLLGGGVKPDGTTIGQIITKIPSKNVPDATILLLKHYADNKQGGEEFNDYYKRIGRKAVEELLSKLTRAPSYDEKPDFYTDWGDKEEFALQKGVVGECAGSPVEDQAPQIGDATPVIEQARALLEHKEYESAVAKAYEAMVKIADAALYTKFVQTFKARESIFAFENHLIRTGDIAGLDHFEEKVEGWRATPSEESAQALLAQAETMLGLCKDHLAAHAA